MVRVWSFLALIALFQTASATCDVVTSTFSCLDYDCTPSRVACTTPDSCVCSAKYFWLIENGNRTADVCGYDRLARQTASILQGTMILIGANGVGMCYLGHTSSCAGALVLSYIGIVILCCGLLGFFTTEQPTIMAVAGIFTCLIMIANLIWWAITLAQIVSGSQRDANGCTTYD